MNSLIIGSLDLSRFVHSIHNKGYFNMRGLDLETEQSLYWLLQVTKREYPFNGLSLYSTYGRGFLFRAKYDKEGKLFLNVAGFTSVCLRNWENEWWQPKQPKRKPWRVPNAQGMLL